MDISKPDGATHPALEWAHPVVQEWFVNRFGTPTEPQEQGWPHILRGSTTLVSAPTGSGKTLAAFLACIDSLVRQALSGGLIDRTEVLYVSPLKALGNDIKTNLEIPLSEIQQLAFARGLLMPQIRAAVRTGDTLMHERRAMLQRPPHILVTTPESLYILLTAAKSREMLRTVQTVIVDEIHAVADDKRGAHLALSLERLEALTGKPLHRIGLSATQKPIEVVARFLAGGARPDPVIVQVGHRRAIDLAVEVPGSEMRRMLPETVLSEVGKLDAAAIAEVREQAWPDVRDADELHDALQTLIAVPEIGRASEGDPTAANGELALQIQESIASWQVFFDELAAQGRAYRASVSGRTFWVAADRAKIFQQLFPDAHFEIPVDEAEALVPAREDAMRLLITGWLQHSGPVHARMLAEMLGLPQPEIENALLRIEASGAVLRGKFTGTSGVETEWCERRLLARIHRLTLGRLRKEIEPVTAAQFMRWLFRWQHVAPGTQLAGERGTLEALRQLQGYEAPANTWEQQILARRVIGYDPKHLDQLCLSGAVGWGRLSPHPAMNADFPDRGRRVTPTSVAPITFFAREDSEWLPDRHGELETEGQRALSPVAREALQFLQQHGASFFADIVRGTRKLKAEIESALWELVAIGFITADGFDNLRALIDAKRRAGQGSGRSTRPRDSVGRWSLLFPGEAADPSARMERICWMLLKRYGVVFREVLKRESILPRWREVLIALRRLEDRGEIRGGRFLSGFVGEQFALPVAVESLRASRLEPPSSEIITISAADPLNLAGIVVPGEKTPAISGRFVSFRDGVALETRSSSKLPYEVSAFG
jgi:RAD3-like DEAD/DEAH box helicase